MPSGPVGVRRVIQLQVEEGLSPEEAIAQAQEEFTDPVRLGLIALAPLAVVGGILAAPAAIAAGSSALSALSGVGGVGAIAAKVGSAKGIFDSAAAQLTAGQDNDEAGLTDGTDFSNQLFDSDEGY